MMASVEEMRGVLREKVRDTLERKCNGGRSLETEGWCGAPAKYVGGLKESPRSQMFVCLKHTEGLICCEIQPWFQKYVLGHSDVVVEWREVKPTTY